jgi:GntR family transcriptional regulator of arabinose operon
MGNQIEDAKISKYAIIRNALIEKIESGEYPPLYKIPSENDFAKIYGVSIITVRKALSDLTNNDKIFRVKGKGSFVSDISKSNNTSNKTGMKIITLSVLMYENSDVSTMQIISGAQALSSKYGYSLVVECCHDNINEETQILEKCIQNHVDGVLLFSANPDFNIPSLKKLKTNGIPFVLIDRGVTQFPATLVTSYNIDGTYKATNYLIKNGHRKIAFVSLNLEIATEASRLNGYKMALDEANIQFEKSNCIDHISENFEELHKVIKTEHITAIVCVNDKSAVQVMNYLKTKDIEVPRDLSITGFDNTEFGKYASTSLTSIKQPFAQIGEVAAEKLIDLIENKNDSYSQIFLPVELIIRDSTAPLMNLL